MGGITSTRAFALRYGPRGLDVRLAGLYGAPEESFLKLLTGMPAQRDWTREALLHRFLGSKSGRKARYATLLVEALEPGQVPVPLASLLAWV